MTQARYVIVVGMDYSTASEQALDEAFAVGRTKHGVQLHVVNVRPAPNAASSSEELSALPPWRLWVSELQEYVARKVAAYRATVGPIPFQHVHTHQRVNDPARELVQLAVSVKADLIVVGSHRWHHSAALPSESVADAVTRLAPCQVRVVHFQGPVVESTGPSATQ